MTTPILAKLTGSELWEMLLSICKGTVPEGLTEGVLDTLAMGVRQAYGAEDSMVTVTAADFNGHDFDGPPFRWDGDGDSPPWLKVAVDEERITVAPGQDTDYAVWAVKTAEGVRVATPGDHIEISLTGELKVLKAP